MTIGESIRYHRTRNHMTQARLAEMIGVIPATVSKWETGAGLPDITMAVPLARALGTTTDELLRFGERRGEWEQRWAQALQAHGAEPGPMLEVSLGALKEFPWDRQFLYRAAVDEQRLAEESDDPQQRRLYLGAAACHAQLLAELDPEDKSAWRMHRELHAAVMKLYE